VLLPRAGKWFVYTEPSAATRLVRGCLASEAEHAQSSAFRSRRLYARFFAAFFVAFFFAGASAVPASHGLRGSSSSAFSFASSGNGAGAGALIFFARRLSMYSCLPAVTSACASGSGTVAVRPVARSRIVQCFIVASKKRGR